MFYLLHGSDSGASRLALGHLKKTYARSEISLFVAADFDFTVFKNTCETKPMFSPKRLVVVEGNLPNPALEQITNYLKLVPSYTDIVFWQDKKVKRNAPLFKTIVEGRSKIDEFKLTLPTEIFPFLDAVIARNKKRVFLELSRLLEAGTEVGYILKMITWQFRNLLFLTFGCQAQRSIHPYVLGKIRRAAKSFKEEELISIYSSLLDYEVALKSSTIGGSVSLHRLLLEII